MRNRERLGNIIVAALVPLLFNINILRRTGDYFLKGLYHSSVQKGDTARAKGEFFEAIQHFSVAYDMVQKLTDHKKEEVCLVNLGMLFWNIGEISESSNFFKKAYQASKKAKNNTSISFCKMALTIIELYELGKRLRDSNQEIESLHRFSSAITLAREINASEFELKCLRQQSIVYLQLEEYAAFLSLFRSGAVL